MNMKITIGANISANGKVLLGENPDHDAPEETIESLMQMAADIGNLVIGRKTYELMLQFPGGIEAMLPGAEIVIMSGRPGYQANTTVVGTPEDAIRHLAAKGFKQVAVGGGTEIYNLFLDRELVTDIYFNLIPVITGSGGVLGTNEQLVTRFALAGTKILAGGAVQVHLTRSVSA